MRFFRGNREECDGWVGGCLSRAKKGDNVIFHLFPPECVHRCWLLAQGAGRRHSGGRSQGAAGRGGGWQRVASYAVRLGGAAEAVASLALFQGHKARGHHMQGIGPFQCWELSPVGRGVRQSWGLALARVEGGRGGAREPRG